MDKYESSTEEYKYAQIPYTSNEAWSRSATEAKACWQGAGRDTRPTRGGGNVSRVLGWRRSVILNLVGNRNPDATTGR